MDENERVEGAALVLLIDDEEWTARSLESILKPEGYAVLRAYTGAQGLELASKVRPDLVLIDFRLPDITGVDLCARMRQLHTIRPSTPILVFSSGTIHRQDELDGFEAGAWGMISSPFNPQELLGRLSPLVAAKRDVDAVLESSFVDPLTGFYNVQGLLRRIAEINADLNRSSRSLAWVVLGPSKREDAETGLAVPEVDLGDWVAPKELTRAMGELLNTSTRSSDTVGRVGDTDFLIVAPGADQSGALRLAERVIDTLDLGAVKNDQLSRLALNVFYAASGPEPETMAPEEFVQQATAALQRAPLTDSAGESRIRPFQGS